MQFELPTQFTPSLVETAIQGLERIFKDGFHYKKCGIMLHDLCNADAVQQTFLHQNMLLEMHLLCKPWIA